MVSRSADVVAIRQERARVRLRRRCAWGLTGREGVVKKVYAGHRVRVLLDGDYCEREISIALLEPARVDEPHRATSRGAVDAPGGGVGADIFREGVSVGLSASGAAA